jgi:hypothetical protein
MESWGFSDKHNVHLGIARARRRPGCAKRAKRRMATKREYRHYVPRLVGLGPPDLRHLSAALGIVKLAAKSTVEK